MVQLGPIYDLKLFDLINTDKAYSESTIAREAFGYSEDFQVHQGDCYNVINDSYAIEQINQKHQYSLQRCFLQGKTRNTGNC